MSKTTQNLIISGIFTAILAVGTVSFMPASAHAQYYSSGYNSGYMSGYSGSGYSSSGYGYPSNYNNCYYSCGSNGYNYNGNSNGYCNYGYNQGCYYYPGYSNSTYPYGQYNYPYYNYPYGYPINSGGYNNGYNNGYGYNYYGGPLQATCSASLSTVSVGAAVTWSVTVYGGRGNYTYNWSGDGVGNSSLNRFTVAYTTPGTKSVAVNVISDGQSVSVSCGTVYVQGNYNYPYYW